MTESSPFVSRMNWLARSDSMDVNNDPRFFEDNVLDKRLDAFAGLGVVSGLFVGVAFDQVFSMKKDMHLFFHRELIDIFQLIGFLLMTIVLWANIIATYVSVAQIYHTYRLMTAGATGFENAKLYYLNPSITFYRHISIRAMLNSLWIFVMGSGLRLWVKFSKDIVEAESPEWISISKDPPESDAGSQPRFEGISLLAITICIIYLLLAFSVYLIHVKHVAVFRERYQGLYAAEQPLLSVVDKMDNRDKIRGRPLDV